MRYGSKEIKGRKNNEQHIYAANCRVNLQRPRGRTRNASEWEICFFRPSTNATLPMLAFPPRATTLVIYKSDPLKWIHMAPRNSGFKGCARSGLTLYYNPTWTSRPKRRRIARGPVINFFIHRMLNQTAKSKGRLGLLGIDRVPSYSGTLSGEIEFEGARQQTGAGFVMEHW